MQRITSPFKKFHRFLPPLGGPGLISGLTVLHFGASLTNPGGTTPNLPQLRKVTAETSSLHLRTSHRVTNKGFALVNKDADMAGGSWPGRTFFGVSCACFMPMSVLAYAVGQPGRAG